MGNDPEILQKEIVYEEAFGKDLNYDSSFDQSLVIGQSYTVEYLLKLMIQESDNVAKLLLQASENEIGLSPNIEETHKLLGFDNISDIITIDRYSAVFRILYNSEFLNPAMSEKALSIMSNSKYENALLKHLPKNLVVAHKYGIRKYEGDEATQLHDCGIIYTKNPYLLCVMTIGKDIQAQEEIIGKISQESYQIFSY